MKSVYDPNGIVFLKHTSLLMVIFGILGILLYALGLAAVIGVGYVTGGIFKGSKDLWGMGLLLAAALSELIAGILGRRGAKTPRRASGSLYLWGILTLLLTAVGLLSILFRGGTVRNWLALPLSLVVPIVYLVGAAKVLKGPIELESSRE